MYISNIDIWNLHLNADISIEIQLSVFETEIFI